MAVLIRGKYPGRRKKITINNSSVFIYQDLELVNRKDNRFSCMQVAPLLPASAVSLPTVRPKPFDNVYPSPQTIMVAQPNMNAIAVCNPPVNNIFNYQGLPCVALQVMPPYEPHNYPNFKQNVNIQPSRVNINQSILNPGISYIIPTSNTTAVQPLKFAPVQSQCFSAPIVHSVKVPPMQEQNSVSTTVPPVKVSTLHGPHPAHVQYHPQKLQTVHSQSSIPVATQVLNFPPSQFQGSIMNTTKEHQMKNYTLQRSENFEIPSIQESNLQENYASDISKDKPSSTFQEVNSHMKLIPGANMPIHYSEEVNTPVNSSSRVILPPYFNENVNHYVRTSIASMPSHYNDNMNNQMRISSASIPSSYNENINNQMRISSASIPSNYNQNINNQVRISSASIPSNYNENINPHVRTSVANVSTLFNENGNPQVTSCSTSMSTPFNEEMNHHLKKSCNSGMSTLFNDEVSHHVKTSCVNASMSAFFNDEGNSQGEISCNASMSPIYNGEVNHNIKTSSNANIPPLFKEANSPLRTSSNTIMSSCFNEELNPHMKASSNTNISSFFNDEENHHVKATNSSNASPMYHIEVKGYPKMSYSINASPFMKVVKEEPKMAEHNFSFTEQHKVSTSELKGQNRRANSHEKEILQKMVDAVLPGMDVDDYISNEISESNKLNARQNLLYHKSMEIVTSPGSSCNYYNNKNSKGLENWNDKRRDIEVSSTAMNFPLREKTQKSVFQHEVITVDDDSVNYELPASQEQALNLSLNGKRDKKSWDEDIRKSVTHKKTGSKQNKKSKKRQGYKKKYNLFDYKNQDSHKTDINNSFSRDPKMHYSLQREKQVVRPSETGIPSGTMYTRIRGAHQRKNSELKPMQFRVLGASSVHSYSGSNDSLLQLQKITSRANSNSTSSTTFQASSSKPSSTCPTSMPVIYDSQIQQNVKPVLQTARYMLKDVGSSLSETEIAWRLEAALYEENPAILYTSGNSLAHPSDNSGTDAFPCCETPALKELTRSPPVFIDQLLHHQQSCRGVGCSEQCKILRAAYTHLYIFRHRCQVWTIFTKVYSKHSRACRLARCPLALCLFMKHELHLNGVSVLPIQFIEERDIVEEQFRRCEKTGPHNAELRCCHLQGSENMAVSEPGMTIPVAEDLRGPENIPCAQEIRSLLQEAHRNKNRSQSVSRMLQVLIKMMRLPV